MANVDWSDEEEVLNFFNGDSEDEDDFDGFNPAVLDFGDINVLTYVPMSDFVPGNDRDNDADLEEGWSRTDSAPLIAPFTREEKLNVEMENDEPLSFLKLFVSDEFMEILVQQTNIYAERRSQSENVSRNSRLKQWRPVNLAEMKVFLAIIISMGLVQKSDVQDYWSTDEVQDTPFFRNTMSRDRFLSIMSNFHITDNEQQIPRGQDGFDALYKVRPFINNVMTAFSDVYSPDKDLSFDEATCAWKGRLRFRVYNPAKPTKFGIKLYQVCEAKSGYCLGFDIYTGSTPCTQYAEAIGIGEEKTVTTRTVVGLLTRCGLLDKGHHVYMDNYYTSPELFEELRVHNTYACGTLRKNRKGVPEAIKMKQKLQTSQVIFRRNEESQLLAVKYHDKRDVHMLSTIHEATMAVLSKRDRNNNEFVAKPACIVDYVSKMGGVDLSDQINQYDSCLRKTTKWYKKLFFHLFNLCIVNSYLLYKKFSEKKLNSHDFKIALARSLIEEAPDAPKPNKSRGRKHTGDKAARLTERHFPENIPAKPGAKRLKPCRDCYACNPKKTARQGFKRKQTSFWCPDCEKVLCVPDCFRVYHSMQNYRAVLLPGAGSDSDSD